MNVNNFNIINSPYSKSSGQVFAAFFFLKLVGGFKYFLFSPLPGEIIQFDSYL